jgi:3-dehydroquinate dehydratase-1
MKFPVKHPAVLGSVTTRAGLRHLSRASAADAVEIRVDALLADGATVAQIESALKKRRQPALLTLRIPPEGGRMPWKLAHRRETFLRLLPHVEAIDIELATARSMSPVLAAARKSGHVIIYSAHALKAPATPAQFAKWTRQFRHGSNTILKIAAQIKSWRDLQRLAAVLIDHPEWNVAVMGLGPHAGTSRSVLAALGSCLVYGYLDRPAAPGQPSAAAVRKMVDSLALERR